MMQQSRVLLSYCLILVASKTPGHSATGDCQLGETWAGHWFESGVREGVNITSSLLSHKGTCVRRIRHSSQYIFKDSKDNCYRCLSIHEKHHNILQYKESKCLSQRNHKEICLSISVDEPLKTLFRVKSVSEKCPISGAHSFTYSRGHGLCSYPPSSMSDCGEGRGLIFRYQACPDIKGSESGVERADCIARWKEGSTYYFVAKITSDHISLGDYEQTFRCFVYQRQYSGFLVSQSGEAKCNLYTAQEGHTTLNLQTLKPEKECEYPAWFRSHRKYLSLDQQKIYHLNHAGTALSIRNSDDQEENELNCGAVSKNNTNFARIIAISTNNCESGYQCIELRRQSADVLTITIGRLSPNKEEACHTQLFFSNIPTAIVTSPHLHHHVCPFSGQYRLSPPLTTTRTRPPATTTTTTTSSPASSSSPLLSSPLSPFSLFSPGSTCPSLVSSCSNSHTMSFIQDCGKSSQDFICHDSWATETGHQVLVSQSKHSARRFCLVVHRTKENITLDLRSHCEERSPGVEEEVKTYSLQYHGDCSPTALATANKGHNTFTPVWSTTLLLLTTAVLIHYQPQLW